MNHAHSRFDRELIDESSVCNVVGYVLHKFKCGTGNSWTVDDYLLPRYK